ncbi:MAG: deoxyribonuclease IV [Elusimicrobiota bacterium]
MILGVHCSIRNGLPSAIDEAVSKKCNALQIFTHNPRGWRYRQISTGEIHEFRSKVKENNIVSVIAHSPYLPNLCTSNPVLYKKSVDTLITDLNTCNAIGAHFLVIHPGSYSENSTREHGLMQLISAVNNALEDPYLNTKDTGTVLLIENVAGGGRRIGEKLTELKYVYDNIKLKERAGFCLDTCHIYAAGYDIKTSAGWRFTVKEIEDTIGFINVRMWHINDSKSVLGAHLDRHEHIGKGMIGLQGIKNVVTHTILGKLPLILETPKDPPGSDLLNLERVRKVS